MVPLHDAVHGFRKSRSDPNVLCASHAVSRVVLKMDLRDFFPSISAPGFRACFAPLVIRNP